MNIQTVSFNGLSFVNVTNPHELEIKDLKRNFGFNPLDLEDYTHRTQIPKIETFKDYSLVVLDFPFFKQNGNHVNSNGQEKADRTTLSRLLNISHATLSSIPIFQFSLPEKRRIITSHVNLFIGKEYLVVLHEGVLSPINEIFSLCQKTLGNRNKFMGQGAVFLAYKIIDALVDSCFPVINELIVMIEKIDQEIENKKSQTALEEISVTRRNIVFLQTMIKPSMPLFKQLEEGKHKTLNGDMLPYWSNILDHLMKIGHRLEDSRELIEGIAQSNDWLIASKTNQIIKVLTIFSAIVLPLNLVASIYGMNIQGLPYAQGNSSFVILLTIMFIIGGGMLFVFRLKRWF
ncbi:MAG: magnesium transporter CorA family protein [Patescibacteria group bacterium]